MPGIIGRNRNVVKTTFKAEIEVSSLAATKLLDANPDRIYATVSLAYGTTDEAISVRERPATEDPTDPIGLILQRTASMNISLFHPVYRTMEDNVYVGEISAIAEAGTVDVWVTEASRV